MADKCRKNFSSETFESRRKTSFYCKSLYGQPNSTPDRKSREPHGEEWFCRPIQSPLAIIKSAITRTTRREPVYSLRCHRRNSIVLLLAWLRKAFAPADKSLHSWRWPSR